jgi:hypothetical protein
VNRRAEGGVQAGQNAAHGAAQLRHYRSGERRHELMTVVSQELTDVQIADLAAWYAAIEVTETVPGRLEGGRRLSATGAAGKLRRRRGGADGREQEALDHKVPDRRRPRASRRGG